MFKKFFTGLIVSLVVVGLGVACLPGCVGAATLVAIAAKVGIGAASAAKIAIGATCAGGAGSVVSGFGCYFSHNAEVADLEGRLQAATVAAESVDADLSDMEEKAKKTAEKLAKAESTMKMIREREKELKEKNAMILNQNATLFRRVHQSTEQNSEASPGSSQQAAQGEDVSAQVAPPRLVLRRS